MEFPLYYILYPFGAFFLAWIIFNLVALYHMFKFGVKNFTTFISVFIYLMIALVILAVSFSYLEPIEWNSLVAVGEGMLDQLPL